MKRHTAIIVGALILIALIFSQSGEVVAEDSLVIQIWSGTFHDVYTEEVVEPFEEKYDVEVITTEGLEWFTLPKIAEGVEAGDPEVDLVQLTVSDFMRGKEMGLWEELDRDKVPNLDDIYEYYVDDYGVGFNIYSMGLLYNEDSEEEPPQDLDDFWDDKYNVTIGETHEQYLIPMVNHMLTGEYTPVDLDAVFEKLGELDNIHTFNVSHAEVRDLIARDEIDLSEVFNSRAGLMIDDGLNVEFVETNSPFIGVDYWGVSKGGNSELAQKFINFSLAKEQQRANAEAQYLGPTNENVELDEDLVEERGIPYGDLLDDALTMEDYEYIAENLNDWSERWTRWMAGY